MCRPWISGSLQNAESFRHRQTTGCAKGVKYRFVIDVGTAGGVVYTGLQPRAGLPAHKAIDLGSWDFGVC